MQNTNPDKGEKYTVLEEEELRKKLLT
jgi:hypothetical protein